MMRRLSQNNCYPAAWHFVINALNNGDDGYLLVHGDVATLINTGQINHAWVETTDRQTAIDVCRYPLVDAQGRRARGAPVARRKKPRVPAAAYYEAVGVRTTKVYTPKEAVRLMLDHGNFCPWG
jgi:hypothetical protein